MNPDLSRLTTIRRIYIYLVALVSFCTGLLAFAGLLRVLADIWFLSQSGVTVNAGGYERDVIARNAGLLLVATALFLIHWGYANHRLSAPAERRAGLRKFFLYGALLASAILAYGSFYQLLDSLLVGILTHGADLAYGPAMWAYSGAMTLVSVLLLGYWQAIIQTDGDYGTEDGVAGALRRLYHAVAGLIGVVLIIVGGAATLEALLDQVVQAPVATSGGVAVRQFAGGAAALVVGLLLARRNWLDWDALIARGQDEGRTGLRRLYLFGAVMVGAIAVLVPLALMVRQGLLLLFGQGDGPGVALLLDLIQAASFIPFGAAVFWWHQRSLHGEELRYGDSDESVTVRRVYRYLTAAIGLALVWFGTVEILQSLIDAAFGTQSAASTGRLWVEPLATGLSLAAVGLPVWLVQWRQIRRLATGDDAASAAERASLPRRIYLYGIALVSALLALFFVAQILYRLFLLLLGDPSAGLWSSATASEVARGAVATLIWLFHMLVLRADNRLAPSAPAALPAEDARQRLEAKIAWLEKQLADARRELADYQSED